MAPPRLPPTVAPVATFRIQRESMFEPFLSNTLGTDHRTSWAS